MSKTKHLDTALEILQGKPTAKRAKGSTFTLTRTGYTVGYDRNDAVLQGARGKTVKTYTARPWASIVEDAQAHVARTPGATLTVFT
jgi:hypothetical protein